MACDIDRKLRLTAALLGAVTHKDLAAAFRRVNPATPFEVERAHKWLQGRASPRQLQVYEDWVRLLDLGCSGAWIANCDAEAFLDAICARHGADREDLLRRAGSPSRSTGRQETGVLLVGSYVCYSHAWSPYFCGRLIRGELSIMAAPAPHRLSATYVETLPTGRLELEGPITVNTRMMHIDARQRDGAAQLVFCLFPPSPPASILAGFMCGATVIGPESQPSATRIIIVRLPGPSARLRTAAAYLPQRGSVAKDLAALGLRIEDPDAVDRQVTGFLSYHGGNGLDQISAAAYWALKALFDRTWLANPPQDV